METEKINNIYLDSSVDIYRTPEIEYEYKTAISDLIEKNYFSLMIDQELKGFGPYDLHLSISENRIVIDIRRLGSEEDKAEKEKIVIPTSPFRSVVKDYFFICESYYKAVKQSTPGQIETIDIAKRTLHNDGANILIGLLKPEIDVDFDTARRLFTLICVLHVR